MPMAQRQEMPMAQNKMADFIETENIAHFKTIVEMEADPAADTSRHDRNSRCSCADEMT
jgi:hypothetical protein